MGKAAIAIALTFCLMSAPALSRAVPHSGTTTCEGIIKQVGNPGWYEIDVCSFDRNTAAGKVILSTCGEGNPCRIKAYGEWAPGFYVKQLISVAKVDKKVLNEIPEKYRGTWVLYRDYGKPSKPGSKEDRMPVGAKEIGWLKGLCNVTSIDRHDALTIVVKELCKGREITELWSLRNLNGTEMLLVARMDKSLSASSSEIAVYVRELSPE